MSAISGESPALSGVSALDVIIVDLIIILKLILIKRMKTVIVIRIPKIAKELK